MADRNYEIGDTLMVLASFANHELTTMMLQLNCEDCGELETATVTKIDALQSTGCYRNSYTSNSVISLKL